MAIISLFSNPMYVWGASIKSNKKPPMGQFLHWGIIKCLKEKKFNIYDLGGIPGEVPKNKHLNYWVWRFKKRFNGNYVESLPYYTYVFNKNLYLIYKISIPIYRKFRKNFLRV